MARVRRDVLQRYTDPRACCYVLSCLMKKTKLLKSKEKRLITKSFYLIP